MADQTVEEVIVAFQKALGRAWKASEEALNADPAIAGGSRQLFGVSHLDIELACDIRPDEAAPGTLGVRFGPPPNPPPWDDEALYPDPFQRSVLRFRVEAKAVEAEQIERLTLSRADVLPDDFADMVLLANLMDRDGQGLPNVPILFQLSRPGLPDAEVREIVTDVRGQAAIPVTVADVNPPSKDGLARRLADADRKQRLLVRASATIRRDESADLLLNTPWTEFTVARPAGDFGR